jgi:hypothetical protein
MTNYPETNLFENIAERPLELKTDNGTPAKEIILRIGKPYWLPNGNDAACAVEIVGIFGRTKDIVGIDPLHALKSAIKFAESFFTNSDENQEYFWPDGDPYEPI